MNYTLKAKIVDWFWSLHLKKWFVIFGHSFKINIDRVYKWKSFSIRYKPIYRNLQITVLTFYISIHL